MASKALRPLAGVCLIAFLAGCQAPSTTGSSPNMSFLAPGAVTALSMRFAAVADPLTGFVQGSAALDDAARRNLRAQARWLAANPSVHVALIAGADTGDRDLAARRAQAVARVFLDQGIARSRLRLAIAGEVATDGEKTMANAVLTEVLAPRIPGNNPLAALFPVPRPPSLATAVVDVETPGDDAPEVETDEEETPGDAPPVNDDPKETPPDDAPEADDPEDEPPVTDTPRDDTPEVVTPKDETPNEETPKDDTPKDDTPKDDTPKDDTPKDDTPKDDTPKDDTPTDDTPSTDKPGKPEKEDKPKGNEKDKRPNAGGGNGGEGGDPGNSEEHNKAGDD